MSKVNRSLTPTQRRILLLMREHGPAMFVLPHKYRQFKSYVTAEGVIIGGYQCPEFFLKSRGIIEPCGPNNIGRYQLTDFGVEIAARLKGPRA